MNAVEPAGGSSEGKLLLVALMAIGRRLRTRLTDRFDPASVFLLHHVLANPLQRLSELAGSVGLDASTVSRHVRQLEDAGYLVRTVDPDDRRASRVAVTDQGRELLSEAMDARAAVVDNAMAGWTDDERQTLTRLATRLAADMADCAERAERGERGEHPGRPAAAQVKAREA